jgi:hypothetical protein
MFAAAAEGNSHSIHFHTDRSLERDVGSLWRQAAGSGRDGGRRRRSWSAQSTLQISSRQIEESISILNFFPPNRGVDFYFEFLPAKSRRRRQTTFFHVATTSWRLAARAGGAAASERKDEEVDEAEAEELLHHHSP